MGCRQHLGLEPAHPARGRGLGINGTPSNELPYHRIERQTIRVIHIIISSQSLKNRLPQKHDQRMEPVLVSSRVSQKYARIIVQAEHFIQFPEQQ